MIKKKYLSTLIMALAILGVTARAYCYNAEVIDLSGRKYFPAVKEALSKAVSLTFPHREEGVTIYSVIPKLVRKTS